MFPNEVDLEEKVSLVKNLTFYFQVRPIHKPVQVTTRARQGVCGSAAINLIQMQSI